MGRAALACWPSSEPFLLRAGRASTCGALNAIGTQRVIRCVANVCTLFEVKRTLRCVATRTCSEPALAHHVARRRGSGMAARGARAAAGARATDWRADG